jgi:hypothetical protein
MIQHYTGRKKACALSIAWKEGIELFGWCALSIAWKEGIV